MNNIGFDPSVPLWSVALVSLITIISIWFEVRKKNKFQFLRAVSIILIGLSLLGFLFRPYYEIKSTREIVLLTPGYKAYQVDSLLKQNPSLIVMHTKACGEVKNSNLIDENFLETSGGRVKMILGEGLSASMLETMSEQNFQFLPSIPQGVTRLIIPSDVVEHEKSTLQGALNCISDTRLRLVGPAGAEDSALFKGGNNQLFALSFRPKQNGKFIYHLEMQDRNQVSQEPIPVYVQEADPVKILFLQKYPTAETKSLKNFLSEQNHSLTLRYQVSKETYTYEFINAPESKFDYISRNSLNEFDLLFIDVSSLNSLSQNERRELMSSIHAGLGIVVLQNEETKNLLWFWPLSFKANGKDTTHIHLSKSKKYVLPVLPLDVTSSKDIYSAVASGSKKLSGYILHGNGKIAFMLLQETYRIKAEGSEGDYAMIWNDLISKTSRKKISDRIKILSSFPFSPNEPINIDVLSKESTLFSDSILIPLKEDLAIDDLWHARAWTSQPGWHELKTKNTTFHYFAVRNSSWKSLRMANRVLETQQAASNNHSTASQMIEQKEVPRLIFMLLFLVSAGLLWVAPKLG